MARMPDLATTRDFPVTVYLPTLTPGGFFPHALPSIDPKSGIVGVPARIDKNTLVYYEGNRYGAVNIVTWADRVDHAADRLRTDYPTVAKAMVPTDQLTPVGTWDGQEITLLDAPEANLVYSWLELHERGEHALDDECLPTRLLNVRGRMEQ